MDFAKLAAERYSLRKFSDRPVVALQTSCENFSNNLQKRNGA